LKQSETIRTEKLPELGDPNRQNSSCRSNSGDHRCCACDACWAHIPSLSMTITHLRAGKIR